MIKETPLRIRPASLRSVPTGSKTIHRFEKLYVFQVRETNLSGPCSGDVARFNVDLRNRQRLFADQFPNLTLMSTTGLDGHEGCHFYFTNGYESLGFNIARMLQRDLYNGPSLPNTNPPNPAYASLLVQTRT